MVDVERALGFGENRVGQVRDDDAETVVVDVDTHRRAARGVEGQERARTSDPPVASAARGCQLADESLVEQRRDDAGHGRARDPRPADEIGPRQRTMVLEQCEQSPAVAVAEHGSPPWDP